MRLGDIVRHYPPLIYFENKLLESSIREPRLVEIVDELEGGSFMVREHAEEKPQMVHGSWLQPI